MATFKSLHFNYINSTLVGEIMIKLKGEKLIDYDVKESGGLDGFMSALYNITLRTVDIKTQEQKERQLIVKFMKGDVAFRESSKSYVQFANEVFVYEKILPYYKEIIRKSGVSTIRVEDWVPEVYAARLGCINGLNDTATSSRESVLVLENLKQKHYTLGPHLYLNREHLLAMTKPLAEYHAFTYVLRIQKDPRLTELIQGIIPLPFCDDSNPNDDKTNLFKVFYRLAFDRFFGYYDRWQSTGGDAFSDEDPRLIPNLNRIREKYFKEPTRLLEFIRTNVDNDEIDRRFSAILHGDYNRNNVLFRYVDKAGQACQGDVKNPELPKDAKMIDFQEIRYGTPAIDLSFFMYMNMDPDIRDVFWMELLKYYHDTMFDTLSSIILSNGGEDQKAMSDALKNYSFDNFYGHFTKYAFYGALICMHFLPFKCCSEEECDGLSRLFETNMHGDEFRSLFIEVGGDECNRRIMDVIRHANRMGYMDQL